jgi:hypothetical protein
VGESRIHCSIPSRTVSTSTSSVRLNFAIVTSVSR